MMRSTQRHSYPMDKSVPKMEAKRLKESEVNPQTGQVIPSYYVGYGSAQRQVEKNMHKKKRRQLTKRLIQTEEEQK